MPEREIEPSGSEQSGLARLENEGGPHRGREPGDSTEETLARFGIVAVPTTMFEWGGYRYTNLSDAVAAAKRGGHL